MAVTITEYEQISGIFKNSVEVESLLADLYRCNLSKDDISVLMSEDTHHKYFAMKTNNKMSEGTTVGGLSGGLLGAIVGGLTMVGTVLIPGVGLLAAGPLVGAIVGGTVGVATGSLMGALVGAGIPEHEAKFYEHALQEEGNVLVVARVPKEDTKDVKAIFERFNADSLKVHK